MVTLETESGLNPALLLTSCDTFRQVLSLPKLSLLIYKVELTPTSKDRYGA